ncbi:MAG: BatA domain-containing protein [Myxococcota bacterium]
MGLAFVAQALAVGVALAGLPLLIHLISKRRARHVRFAALDFIVSSKRRTTRSLRLRQWLLLSLRTLLVAAIAAAVAGPFLEEDDATADGAQPLVVILAIDDSASMHATLDGRSAFQRARAAAERVLEETAADVRFALLACSDRPRDVVATPTFERAPLRRAIKDLIPRYGRSDLTACIARAADVGATVEGEGDRRVMVFSDLAAHAFVDGARPVRGSVSVEWHPAFDEEAPPNHGLSRPEVLRTRVGDSDGVSVSFSLSQFGGLPHEVPVDLFLADQRAARLTVAVTSGAGERRSFAHALSRDGALSAEESFVEARLVTPSDALALDNELLLPMALTAPVSVLVVDGAPQPVPFRDEVFYLESALRQGRAGAMPFAVRVTGEEGLHAGALAEAKVVVLANVARVSDEGARALIEFVRAGGGLLVTAGDQIDIDWYNATLSPLLPGRLRGAKGQALLDDANIRDPLGFARMEESHPLFAELDAAQDGGLVGLRRVQSWTTLLLEPEPGAQREVLVHFSNDTPALAGRYVDSGRVLLLATTIDRDWTDFPIRPGFLPLVQQMVLYLAGALDAGSPRLVTVGDPHPLLLPRGATSLEVRGPLGTRERLTPLSEGDARADGSQELSFSKVEAPGLYRVFASFAEGELRELAAERFAASIPPEESDLRRASPEVLRSALPEGAIQRAGASGRAQAALWPWLLLLAIGLLLAESAMLRRDVVGR